MIPILSQEVEAPKKVENQIETLNDDKTQTRNQAERRVEKKFQFSYNNKNEVNYNFKISKELSLNFFYNLNKYFSLGINYTHFNKEKEYFSVPLTGHYEIEKRIYYQRFSYNSFEENKNNLNLLFRIFPIEKIPIYFTTGIGREITGTKSSSLIFLRSNDSKYSDYFIYGTADLKPFYKNIFGLGFQWVFENGFFLNFEILQIKKNTRSKVVNEHIYTNYEGISTDDRIKNYLYLTIFPRTNSIQYRTDNSLYLSIGYAF